MTKTADRARRTSKDGEMRGSADLEGHMLAVTSTQGWAAILVMGMVMGMVMDMVMVVVTTTTMITTLAFAWGDFVNVQK